MFELPNLLALRFQNQKALIACASVKGLALSYGDAVCRLVEGDTPYLVRTAL